MFPSALSLFLLFMVPVFSMLISVLGRELYQLYLGARLPHKEINP